MENLINVVIVIAITYYLYKSFKKIKSWFEPIGKEQGITRKKIKQRILTGEAVPRTHCHLVGIKEDSSWKEGKSLHFQNEKNWDNKNRIKKEEWEIWKKELISEHGEIIGSKLADGELAVGMNYDHVVIWWGSEEDKKVSEAINKKEITKLYFGESKNRLGNEKFSYEVTLENGKVVGWTDLKNRRSQRS
jgi:hypothetical protein